MDFQIIFFQVLEIFNKYARQRGRVLEFQDLLYGYRRIDPLHGVDYVLDLLLLYKKFKGRKVTVPVRRHAYLQQTFAELEFIEETDYQTDISSSTLSRSQLLNEQNKAEGDRIFSNERNQMLSYEEIKQRETIHIILPLYGRFDAFQRFMLNYERTCLMTKELVYLLVVLFSENSDFAEKVSKQKYIFFTLFYLP